MGVLFCCHNLTMLVIYNPNPKGSYTGDCVVRAISKALDTNWHNAYLELVVEGYMLSDMPSANSVWGALLREHGFIRRVIPNSCPDCYTVRDFCDDHQTGMYVLGTGTHVVTVVDGDYYDTWDSGAEVPLYYYEKE